MHYIVSMQSDQYCNSECSMSGCELPNKSPSGGKKNNKKKHTQKFFLKRRVQVTSEREYFSLIKGLQENPAFYIFNLNLSLSLCGFILILNTLIVREAGRLSADLVQAQNKNTATLTCNFISAPVLHTVAAFSQSFHVCTVNLLKTFLSLGDATQKINHPTSRFNNLCVLSIQIFTSAPSHDNSSPGSSRQRLAEALR